MSKHYRVTFETSSPQSAIFAALDLLDITGTLTYASLGATNDKAKKSGRGPDKKPRKIRGTPPPKTESKHYAHPRPAHHTDARLVWSSRFNRINVDASLKNINMTRADLTAMHCKHGSIEYTLKQAMKKRGY